MDSTDSPVGHPKNFLFPFRAHRFIQEFLRAAKEKHRRRNGSNIDPPLPTPLLVASCALSKSLTVVSNDCPCRMGNVERSSLWNAIAGWKRRKKRREKIDGKRDEGSNRRKRARFGEDGFLLARAWTLCRAKTHTHTEFLLSREFFFPRGRNETCPVCSRRKYLLLVEAARSEANIFRNLSRKIFWEKNCLRKIGEKFNSWNFFFHWDLI